MFNVYIDHGEHNKVQITEMKMTKKVTRGPNLKPFPGSSVTTIVIHVDQEGRTKETSITNNFN